MERNKILEQQWIKENEPIGKYLGYPECCIKEFCDQPPHKLKDKEPTGRDKLRLQRSYINRVYTGFIPCYRHAREIQGGITKLTELIKNRRELLPFPYA